MIINFFKGLFADDGKVSSKRFCGIVVLIVTICMSLGSQFSRYKLDYAVFITYIGFVLGCFGMNTVLSAKSMEVKKDVANSMVSETGDNEAAASTLQAEKPK
jgi:hypothetical protein